MLSVAEFNDWSAYHESCFRGFIEYLCETEQRPEVWRTSLDGYTVAELKQASHAMFAGTEKPIGWSSHMESMQRHLRRFRELKREQENAAQYARRCGLCEGTGRVDVVALPGHEFTTFGGGKVIHGVAACKCGLGDQYRARTTDKGTTGVGDFDATRMERRNAWYLRKAGSDPERDEAAQTMRGTAMYLKRKLGFQIGTGNDEAAAARQCDGGDGTSDARGMRGDIGHQSARRPEPGVQRVEEDSA